ncbi:MAG: tetratricopeptide repeat protein [Phormidesmis sp.]
MKKLQHLLIAVCTAGAIALPQSTYTASAQSAPPSTGSQLVEDEADSLDQQVIELFNQSRYAEALPIAKESLAIRERQLGPNHPNLATSLNNLASLHSETGDYATAQTLYERALSINEAALGPEHYLTGLSLQNLASLYVTIGEYDQAESMYRQTLAIWTQTVGEDHPDIAIVSANLADLYRTTGNYAEATSFGNRALSIREAAFGPEHPLFALSLHNLALIYQTKGDMITAIPLYERSIAIRRAALGNDHPSVGVSLGNLGSAYADQNNYSKATALIEQSVSILEAAYGVDSPDAIEMLSSLGTIYVSEGDYAAALPLFERVLRSRESRLGRDHPLVGLSITNLAAVYLRREDYSPAIALFKRGISILEAAYGESHQLVASNINNLAIAYEAQNDQQSAIPLYEKSLSIMYALYGDNHPNIAATLNNLGLVYRRDNNPGQAIALFRSANLIEEYNLNSMLISASETRRQKYIQSIEQSTNRNVSIHLNDRFTSPEVKAQAAQLAMETILQRKGRILEAVANTSQQLRAKLSPAEQSVFDDLNAVRAALAELQFSEEIDQTDPDYINRLRTLEAEAEALDEGLARRSATFSAAAEDISIGSVQSKIPTDAALVEFIRYYPYSEDSTTNWLKPRYAAYVLMTSGSVQAVDLGDATEIDATVGEFRKALSNRSQQANAIARQLNEQLIAPIRPFLSGKSHLLLSPDSQLNLIPFDALVDAQDRYLIGSYQISYLNSGRDLLKLQADAPSRQASVVIANPNYEGSSSSAGNGQRSVDANSLYFSALPGTAAEGSAIASLLPSATLLTQQQATESALKQVSGPSILHIATHGFFLPDVAFVVLGENSRAASFDLVDVEAPAQVTPSNLENPLLRSGLAFTGANNRSSGSEDGIFTALEASGLDLYGTQLVVLSACETGIGAASSGEGVYGLRRAFAIAGAESQMMSLWQVDDTGTSELMQLYYKNLVEKKQGRSEALRNAQLELLNTGTYQHPYYWSSFIFSGDWRPLE